MEGDIDQIYDLIYKLDQKISDLEKKHSEIDVGEKDDMAQDIITDQERIVVDSHSLGEYKNVSLSNGSTMKIKSYPLCANGRHIIKNLDDIVFCSKCGNAICKEHNIQISPPLCINCVNDIIGPVTQNELLILSVISKGVSYWSLSKSLKLSWRDIKTGIQNLQSLGYIRRSIFRYETTLEGEKILNLARFVYDI